MKEISPLADGFRRGAGCPGSRALSLLEPFWDRLGKHLVGRTQARSDCGLGWASYIMPSSLPLSVVCFQCFGFGQRLAVSLPKSPGWAITPNSGLGSYLPSPTPTDTKKDHLGKKTQARPLDLLSASSFDWQGQAASQELKFSPDAPCSESGRCCLQWQAAGICTHVATLQSNDPLSLHISRKPDGQCSSTEAWSNEWRGGEVFSGATEEFL